MRPRHWCYVTVKVTTLDDIELPFGAQSAGSPKYVHGAQGPYWLVGYWDTFRKVEE